MLAPAEELQNISLACRRAVSLMAAAKLMSYRTILVFAALPAFLCSFAINTNSIARQGTIMLCSVRAEDGAPSDLNDCTLHAHIEFDDSSVEEIFNRPEQILTDPDRFWSDNKTYRLVAMWHNSSRTPIPHESWNSQIEMLAGLGSSDRAQWPFIHITRELMASTALFREKALPHICSFLPQESIDLRTTIHYTGLTVPRAFQLHSHIVLDVANSYYSGNTTAILNCLVHEVFHIGFGNHQRLRRELDLDNDAVNSMLNSLQNEGMATYVAYKAQHVFPAPDDRDYKMLERDEDVRQLLADLDNLFREAGSMESNKLWTRGWEIGIQKRAYYVVGASMARTIDETLGREALVATVEEGPRDFVHTYNGLVDPAMRLFEFEAPREFSRQQRIRQSALDGDYETLLSVLSTYTQERTEPETSLENTLVSTGILLQHRGQMELAYTVLETNLAVFPQSSAACQFLGDAYARGGLNDRARACYEKSIKLEPNGICAFNSEQALVRLAED